MGDERVRRSYRGRIVLGKPIRYTLHRTYFDILLQVFPLVTPLVYFFVAPKARGFTNVTVIDDVDAAPLPPSQYAPLAQDPCNEDSDDGVDSVAGMSPRHPRANEKPHISLSVQDKWRLVKPLLLKYMFPLCESQIAIARFCFT